MIYVKDIMSREIKTILPSATLYKAAVVMSRSKVGSVVSISGGKCTGILTEGDVSRAIAQGKNPKNTTVASVMSKPVITTTSDVRLEEAAKLMSNAGIKKLPVIEDGKPVGIVTQTDIVAYSFDLITTLKELVRARYRPPDFQP
jgi:CBS domain-containing protein